MKRRDLIKQLEAAGYRKARDDGAHTIYKNQAVGLSRSPGTGKSMKIQLNQSCGTRGFDEPRLLRI